jgi:hypothetical protein
MVGLHWCYTSRFVMREFRRSLSVSVGSKHTCHSISTLQYITRNTEKYLKRSPRFMLLKLNILSLCSITVTYSHSVATDSATTHTLDELKCSRFSKNLHATRQKHRQPYCAMVQKSTNQQIFITENINVVTTKKTTVTANSQFILLRNDIFAIRSSPPLNSYSICSSQVCCNKFSNPKSRNGRANWFADLSCCYARGVCLLSKFRI